MLARDSWRVLRLLALAVGALCDALAVWRVCGMRGGLVLGVCDG